MHFPLLRKADVKDAEFIYRVYERTAKILVERTGRRWSTEPMRKKAQDDATEPFTRIVSVDNTECGFVGFEVQEREVVLHSLFLLPNFQGRGIGTSLMTVVHQAAAVNSLPVSLHVAEFNPARLYYERRGYVVQDKSHGHYLMRRAA
jgi:GNAT superfamily N-acetyltransferase